MTTSENIALETRLIVVAFVFGSTMHRTTNSSTQTPSSRARSFRSILPGVRVPPRPAGREGARRCCCEKAKGEKQKSRHVERKLEAKKKDAKIDPLLETQFGAGRLYAVISSRPGQVGRADGYIFEGKWLESYIRKLRAGKHK